MITRMQAEETILEYLRSRAPGAARIDPDLDLLENRIIDSLGFTEFVFFLEELRGIPLDLDDVRADDFRTVRAIGLNFMAHLAGQADCAEGTPSLPKDRVDSATRET